MSPDGANAIIVKELGWRQGSIVPQAIVDQLQAARLLSSCFDTGDILMVVSHDCDVTHEDFTAEPSAELLIVRVAKDRDGNFYSCKNPRHFQVEDKASGQPVVYTMSIHDRFHIPRTYLASAGPDATRRFEKETVQRIAFWVSRRYSRPSFPDAFNDRTRPALSNLSKEFKKNGECVSGIYLVVTDEELPNGQDYLIVIRATMTVEYYADEHRRKIAQELLDKLEAVLGKCNGVDVQESHLVSETEVSLDDLRLLKRWDFDSISLRTESVASLPRVS